MSSWISVRPWLSPSWLATLEPKHILRSEMTDTSGSKNHTFSFDTYLRVRLSNTWLIFLFVELYLEEIPLNAMNVDDLFPSCISLIIICMGLSPSTSPHCQQTLRSCKHVLDEGTSPSFQHVTLCLKNDSSNHCGNEPTLFQDSCLKLECTWWVATQQLTNFKYPYILMRNKLHEVMFASLFWC